MGSADLRTLYMEKFIEGDGTPRLNAEPCTQKDFDEWVDERKTAKDKAMTENERDVLDLLTELYEVATEKIPSHMSTDIDVIANQVCISESEARKALEALEAKGKITRNPETWMFAHG